MSEAGIAGPMDLARGPELREANRRFAVGMARAFAGAVFFSLPLLMTMEMWSLGVAMSRWKLALLIAVMLPVLIGLDHYSGFEETSTWREDVLDALAAYAVGFAASLVILTVFNVVSFDQPLGEIVGKVALQAVPAGFGAVLAASQLGGGGSQEERRKDSVGYAGELFFMLAGAMFLAFNVAPTEEMILISYTMTPWHAIALVLLSLGVMYGFVYRVEFRGGRTVPADVSRWGLFLRFSVVGYAIALGVSAYVLWTFGRYGGESFAQGVMSAIVLGFPATLGAAAARLIL